MPIPLCGYDVDAQGNATAIADQPPENGYRWLHFDLGDPTFEPWARAQLPLAAAKALTQSETRPRCDGTPSGIIVNLRGVNLNPGAEAEDMVSVRLWVTENMVVSARRYKIFAVDAIRADMDANRAPKSVSEFLAALTFGLTKRIEAVSLACAELTDDVEDIAFDPTAPPPDKLPALRQRIIKLRRFVRPQSEALRVMGEGDIWPLDDISRDYMRDTVNRTQRTLEELDATSDRLAAIQDHEDAQAAIALGRNTYVLSIIAGVFLPLGFLTGLFGINVGGMPMIENGAGFAIVAGGCVAIGALVLVLFRYLRWV